jgi:hypothetical protein
VACGIAACRRDPPAPANLAVVPAWAFNQEETAIVVTGDNLIPALNIDVDPAGEASTSSAWRAWLEPMDVPLADGATLEGFDFALRQVSLTSSGVLEARVPTGFPAGAYELWVETPYGGRAADAPSFEVVDTRAEALTWVVEDVSWDVYEVAEVELRLTDPSGAPLAQDREVVLELRGDSGGDLVPAWEDGALEDQRSWRPAGLPSAGLRGRLGVDGVARVRFSVREPGVVTLSARPASAEDPVAGDEARLEFSPSAVAAVRVDLPRPSFSTSAGETFSIEVSLVDSQGEVVEDASQILLLSDTCSNPYFLAPTVRGRAEIAWRSFQATDTIGCREKKIVVVSGPPGESAPFQVAPGPAVELGVALSESAVVAGQPFIAVVSPIDAFSNLAPWTSRVARIEDARGPAQAFSCSGGAPAYCTVNVARAGAGQALTVTDDAGLVGVSRPIDVAPAAWSAVSLSTSAQVWTAGRPERVWVAPWDAWGNPLPIAGWGGASLSDERGDLACGAPFASVDPAGQPALESVCAWTVARADAQLLATDQGVPLPGGRLTIPVVNGALARIDVVASPGVVEAGGRVDVDVATFDAWGNPWVSREVSTLALYVEGEPDADAVVALDATGQGRSSVVLQRRGGRRIEVEGPGGVVGASSVVEVTPGEASAIVATVASPWVQVGEPARVDVELIDGFGNRTEDRGVVVLTSERGGVAPTQVPISNGLGQTSLTWAFATLDDALLARGDGGLEPLAGGSGPLLVWADCEGGPTASFSVSGVGEDGARGCTDDLGAAELVADFGGSSLSAGADLWTRAVAVGDQVRVAAASEQQSVLVEGLGRVEISGLIVQADGCGAEATREAWVGPDDGRPVGPIEVRVAALAAPIGGGAGTIGVSFGASTCHGAPAAGEALWVRADRGVLLGAQRSGSGLQVLLDARGEATLDLGVAALDQGGLATITAVGGDEAGVAARGVGEVSLLGDVVAPFVVDQAPRGALVGPIESISLTFSEPLDLDALTPSAFHVEPAASAPAVVDVWADLSRQIVEVTLDAPLLPGAWAIVVDPVVRDRGANALAGTWAGVPAPYRGLFGEVFGAPDMMSCALSAERFQPDGDPGVGEQADAVHLDYAADGVGSWWVVSVFDASGAWVDQARLVPVSTSASWSWDGRDFSGRVVDPGVYTVVAEAEGSRGERGVACARSVTLTQRGAP